MSRKEQRPPLGGISMDDDLARIRAYGLQNGFLPTDATAPPPATSTPPAAVSAPQPVPPPAVSPPVPPAPVILRPAPTKPWQAMLPDYLVEELRQAAAREGTAQKVIVMRALRQAGYRVDDIDLQDLRKR